MPFLSSSKILATKFVNLLTKLNPAQVQFYQQHLNHWSTRKKNKKKCEHATCEDVGNLAENKSYYLATLKVIHCFCFIESCYRLRESSDWSCNRTLCIEWMYFSVKVIKKPRNANNFVWLRFLDWFGPKWNALSVCPDKDPSVPWISG